MKMNTNLIEHKHVVTKEDRQKLIKQKSPVIWLTGLSASGKSTIANELALRLQKEGKLAYILDGDNIRMGLNKDLGFSDDDRKENIRRIAEVAKLLSDSGVIVITAFISPFREEREKAKDIIGRDNFLEVYVKADLDICEQRDPKGLYKKARAGEIKQFTGIDSPYEEPIKPFRTLDTDKWSIEQCTDVIIVDLKDLGIIESNLKEVNNLDKRNTIAIDFDGVIHKYSKGFKGLGNAYDPPMEGTEESLKKLHEEGYILKILSSRPKEVINPWLEKYGLSKYITEVSNHKFPATVYIDDRGMLFENWEKCLNELQLHPKIKK
jgi:adenylylsulfate kinase